MARRTLSSCGTTASSCRYRSLDGWTCGSGAESEMTGMLGTVRFGGVLAITLGLAGSAAAQQATPEKIDPASVEAIAAAQAELAELDSQRSELEASIAEAKKRQDALRAELESLEKD